MLSATKVYLGVGAVVSIYLVLLSPLFFSLLLLISLLSHLLLSVCALSLSVSLIYGARLFSDDQKRYVRTLLQTHLTPAREESWENYG